MPKPRAVRHQLTETQKILIVKLIDKRKDILFGSFSDRVTNESKERKWNEVINECKNDYGFDAGIFLFKKF